MFLIMNSLFHLIYCFWKVLLVRFYAKKKREKEFLRNWDFRCIFSNEFEFEKADFKATYVKEVQDFWGGFLMPR